jgi:hypothetical protein
MASERGPDSGFLSRWSRRKAEVRQGVPEREAVPAPAAVAAPVVLPEPPEPAPTLADAAQLTPASDFTRFVARGVDPSVKNTALKTLFSDPHFNVMDGLDTYIEDYGRPDPLPLAMLRQMTGARMLGLFTEEPEAQPVEKSVDENAAVRLQPNDPAGHQDHRPDPGADPGGERGRAGDDAHPSVPA